MDFCYFFDFELEFIKMYELIENEIYIVDFNWYCLLVWQELIVVSFDFFECWVVLWEVDIIIIDYEKGNIV